MLYVSRKTVRINTEAEIVQETPKTPSPKLDERAAQAIAAKYPHIRHWTFAMLRDTINSSNDVGLLEA